MSTVQRDLVYPVPACWRLRTVDEIKAAEPSACVAGPFGSKIASRYFTESGVPVVRGSNLTDDLTRFVTDSFVFLSEEKAQEFGPQHVRAGDLVFTCWGTLGQVGLVPTDGPFPEYIISNKQLKLRLNRAIADPEFCYYYFASPRYVANLRDRNIGGAVPGINLGILKSLRIALPELAVQREIARTLSAYDHLIDNNRRRIKLLEDSVRLLFDEWFVRLRFPGHESSTIADGVPHGWSKLPLDEVLLLQRGFDLPSQDREAGDIPIYGSTGIVGSHNKAKVTGPGIATGRSGTLGEVHYVAGEFWPLNTALWVKEFKRATPLFALHLLRGMNLGQYNGGVSVPTLDRKVVHKAEIVLPPVALIARFDEVAKDVRQQIDTLAAMNDKLRAARDLLLPRLMSGELTV